MRGWVVPFPKIGFSEGYTYALREAFSDYVEAARKVSDRQTGSAGGSTLKPGELDELARIRKSANAIGHEPSTRGRIS